jgi:hypothetical protein
MMRTIQQTEAIQLARQWVACRAEVRKQLIAMAREASPLPLAAGQGNEREIWKLWQFPSDLSEERLLRLIDNGEGKSHPGASAPA